MLGISDSKSLIMEKAMEKKVCPRVGVLKEDEEEQKKKRKEEGRRGE